MTKVNAKLSERQLQALRFYAAFGTSGVSGYYSKFSARTLWSLRKLDFLYEHRPSFGRVHSITDAGRVVLEDNDAP
jgi:biotin-(acetyl-CoA carboxylase) ligase